MSLFYRTSQFLHSIKAKPLTQAEKAFIESILTASQAFFFFQLAIYEQRHALRVCQTLCAGGHGTDKELLQASLLHDLGKSDPQNGRFIPVWGKIANVLFSMFKAKSVMRKLAKAEPKSWRYVFWLQLHHEQRGASLAEKMGSSRRVVNLIGGYSAALQQGDPAMIALKWADDLN